MFFCRDLEKELKHVFSLANSEYADIRDALPKDTMSQENLIDGVENRLSIFAPHPPSLEISVFSDFH